MIPNLIKICSSTGSNYIQMGMKHLGDHISLQKYLNDYIRCLLYSAPLAYYENKVG
jgi:hypothetical protein